MKNMPDMFSIDIAYLQISPFKELILYSFWAITPKKKLANIQRWDIFLIEVLSMLASPQIKTVKPPYKKPSISERSSFLHRRSVKIQFVWQKLSYHILLVGLLQRQVGLHDSSKKYQKSFVCLRKMCLMVLLWKCTFYRNDDLSMTCQCRQFKLNLMSTQINICCLITDQTPALLVQHTLWMRAAMILLQSLYFSRSTPLRAIIPDACPLGT